MLLPFASGLNPPPPPPLVPRADVVFALQRSGADVVFAYQFPVAAAVAPPVETSGGWGHLPIPEPFRERRSGSIEVPRAVRELEGRAAEIAAATVARAAAAPEAPASLAEVMQVWAMPVSLSALVAHEAPAVNPFEPLRASSSTFEPAAPLAALDEDAILAASILLMRRRR